MGVERKTMVLSDREKTVTAYHEAGHALVAAFVPEADPLHKVTVIPRGRALGLTQQLPVEERFTYRKTYVLSQIAILMGGRVAEELTQDDITTGAGNDIERATDLARRMTCEWGMSNLGPLALGTKGEPVFLGRDIAKKTEYGGETASLIDQEIKKLVDDGHETATRILSDYKVALEEIARQLLIKETLDGEAVYRLIEETTDQKVMPESLSSLPPTSPSNEDSDLSEEESGEEASPPSQPPRNRVERRRSGRGDIRSNGGVTKDLNRDEARSFRPLRARALPRSQAWISLTPPGHGRRQHHTGLVL